MLIADNSFELVLVTVVMVMAEVDPVSSETVMLVRASSIRELDEPGAMKKRRDPV